MPVSNAEREKGGVTARVKEKYGSLRDSEKKVADFILQNQWELFYLSIREMSSRIQTSEATVVRFCQQLGLKGYQDLKIALALEFNSPMVNLPEDIKETDNAITIARKVTQNNIRAMSATCEKLDAKELERAIDLIAGARMVDFYGLGHSGIVARNAHFQFMRIGINCGADVDPFFSIISASQLGSKDVAIGISYSGLTKDMIKIMATAKDTGAATIAITSDLDSPMAKVCDIKFESVSKELPIFGAAVAARSAQFNVIDILYVGTVLKLKDQALDALKKGSLAVTYKSILL